MVWIVHIQSESCENYYKVFKKEPTPLQIENFQKEMYECEMGEKPQDEYFTDLMGLRNVVKVKME